MQYGCEVIYPAVFQNTVHGKPAFEEAKTTNLPYVVEAIGPQPKWHLGKKNGSKNIIIYDYKEI